jgi:hypothetical protein
MATTLSNIVSETPVANVGTDGIDMGKSASKKVGFYGKTPVIQRAYSSAVHATSAASVSSSFGATQLAILQELMNTNIALGIWATA